MGFLDELSAPPKHGTELVYAEYVGVAKNKLNHMVLGKKQLLTPAWRQKRENTPDYANREVARDYETYVKSFKRWPNG